MAGETDQRPAAETGDAAGGAAEALAAAPAAAAPKVRGSSFKAAFAKAFATVAVAGLIALVAILVDRGCIEDEEELVWESTTYTTSQ